MNMRRKTGVSCHITDVFQSIKMSFALVLQILGKCNASCVGMFSERGVLCISLSFQNESDGQHPGFISPKKIYILGHLNFFFQV